MQDAAHTRNVQATFDGAEDGNESNNAGSDGITVNMIDPLAFDKVAA